MTSTTAAVPKPSQDTKKIQAMFGDIADRYDLLNRILSGGTDVSWRKLVVDEAMTGSDRLILDLACGTGDLALGLCKSAHPECKIVGADFTIQMLRKAQEKDPSERIPWVEADGLYLPFQDNQFDLLTIAFGIRNMESLDKGLSEMLRVLKPGGRLAILEFSQPENRIIRALLQPYFLHVLPRIGAFLSQRSAYLYLPFSILHFPGRRELARIIRRNGFKHIRHCALTFGVAALHIAEKPKGKDTPR